MFQFEKESVISSIVREYPAVMTSNDDDPAASGNLKDSIELNFYFELIIQIIGVNIMEVKLKT